MCNNYPQPCCNTAAWADCFTIIPTRFTAASTTFCGCCCFINEKESSYQGLRVSVGPAPFSAFIRTDATMLESKTVYL